MFIARVGSCRVRSRKAGAGKKIEKALLQRLGMGGEPPAAEDGRLPEGFLKPHDVQHLFLSFR